jgi:hypothetical protein
MKSSFMDAQSYLSKAHACHGWLRGAPLERWKASIGDNQCVGGRPCFLCRSAVTDVLSMDDVALAACPAHLIFLLTEVIHGSSLVTVIILATRRADACAHSTHAMRSSSGGRSFLSGCSLNVHLANALCVLWICCKTCPDKSQASLPCSATGLIRGHSKRMRFPGFRCGDLRMAELALALAHAHFFLC